MNKTAPLFLQLLFYVNFLERFHIFKISSSKNEGDCLWASTGVGYRSPILSERLLWITDLVKRSSVFTVWNTVLIQDDGYIIPTKRKKMELDFRNPFVIVCDVMVKILGVGIILCLLSSHSDCIATSFSFNSMYRWAKQQRVAFGRFDNRLLRRNKTLNSHDE